MSVRASGEPAPAFTETRVCSSSREVFASFPLPLFLPFLPLSLFIFPFSFFLLTLAFQQPTETGRELREESRLKRAVLSNDV